MSHTYKYPGIIYLIPTRLGMDQPHLEVLPMSIKRTVGTLDYFIAENEKTARRFIKAIAPKKSQPSLNFELINKFTNAEDIPSFLNPCKEGHNIGLLSEAVCPGIADPGAEVVRIAHQIGVKVVPLVGPSSILLAMMSSGMNGQNFTFNGYLPIDDKERQSAIKALERMSALKDQAQIFIETPYRNNKMLETLVNSLHPNTRICVACDITLNTEMILTKTAAEWKNTKVDLHKRPTIFIVQKDGMY